MFSRLTKKLSRFTKKRVLVALAAVAALAVAGIAYGYLNAGGSGGGSGNVSATASAPTLTVTQGGPFTELGNTETATVTAKNNGTSPQEVTIATLTVAPSATAKTAGCPAGSFVRGAIVSTPQEIAPGKEAVIATAPVTFTDTPEENQNGCLGTETVSYSATSG
jgi:hypothetical protein